MKIPTFRCLKVKPSIPKTHILQTATAVPKVIPDREGCKSKELRG